MKNTKRKGNRNERRSMRLLELAGYRCTHSAASLGDWDVIGIGKTDFVLCQVKSNRPPGMLERRVLEEFSAPANTKKLLHIWHDRAREPVVVEL